MQVVEEFLNYMETCGKADVKRMEKLLTYLGPLKSLPPYHACGTALRPHIVQFGEPIDSVILDEALRESMSSDLFLVIGTSGVVSPARDLPLLALKEAGKVIEINRDETVLTPYVTLSVKGKSAEIVPRLWREFLEISKLKET